MGSHESTEEAAELAPGDGPLACLTAVPDTPLALFEQLRQSEEEPIERLALFVRVMRCLEQNERHRDVVWIRDTTVDYLTLILVSVAHPTRRLYLFIGSDWMQTCEKTVHGELVGRITCDEKIDETLEAELTYRIGRLSE